ncbi:MAG: HAD family hydrolase [Proteobacteria bacterium]|nr:HAD family hydrolase [Pseudomonadota bacterium]
MTIVFDVDGTLIGGEKTDWKCFDDAFKEAAGFPLASSFFHSLKEVTAQAIVHQALDGATCREKHNIEAKTRQGYLDRLEKAIRNDPDAFPAMEGAALLIQDIQKRGVPIAIATGDWQESDAPGPKDAEAPAGGIEPGRGEAPEEGVPRTHQEFPRRREI